MSTYYNEIDPYCCQWLKNLIAAGHLPKGDVDDRDIRQVQPDDLEGYTQAHFFAGIGGWPYALRLAGWPDDRPVWTGSCPCQPFSAAGKGRGAADERHLWPDWFSLIRECKPATVFGEQVDAAIRWGWLDAVFSDLEAEGYACGASVLPACSVGAPHIRQRLWFVADSLCGRADNPSRQGVGTQAEIDRENRDLSGERLRLGVEGTVGELVNPERGRCEQCDEGEREFSELGTAIANHWSNLAWLPCTDGKQRPTGIVEHTESNGRGKRGPESSGWGTSSRCSEDGQQRPTQSIIQPLAHGVPARVAKLRAAGNAIVPQVAAEFIKAAMNA